MILQLLDNAVLWMPERQIFTTLNRAHSKRYVMTLLALIESLDGELSRQYGVAKRRKKVSEIFNARGAPDVFFRVLRPKVIKSWSLLQVIYGRFSHHGDQNNHGWYH